MKVTSITVRQFETDQKKYGTEIAIFNLLWSKAAKDMMSLGVKRVRTYTKDDPDIHVS